MATMGYGLAAAKFPGIRLSRLGETGADGEAARAPYTVPPDRQPVTDLEPKVKRPESTPKEPAPEDVKTVVTATQVKTGSTTGDVPQTPASQPQAPGDPTLTKPATPGNPAPGGDTVQPTQTGADKVDKPPGTQAKPGTDLSQQPVGQTTPTDVHIARTADGLPTSILMVQV